MTESKKGLPKWPILLIAIIILTLFILNPLCRYFYTKDFVQRGDVQLAEMLAHDMETAGVSNPDKPVFFIGASQTRTNGSCLDLSDGRHNIYSVFAVADVLDLNTVDASCHIVEYLNSLGYSYTAPTPADWAAYEAEIAEVTPLWKAFPWYDSIKETEHCIIVQLTYVNVFE